MFHFKLEFLLRYRTQKEEMAMYELAQRVREANQIENELLEIQDRCHELAEEVSSRTADDCVPAPVYCMYKHYLDHLRTRTETTEKRLNKAERRIEEHRVKLVEASVARKTMDLYKDGQLTEYKEKEHLSEQKKLDELATLARSRRAREDQ
jgi:flagellar export protein FliJ